ncbi:MAG: hypothetical protein IPL56_09125 [Saprospiraceae bacterium]|nr:hypothetical protein [Saprospiraceae bacterium]
MEIENNKGEGFDSAQPDHYILSLYVLGALIYRNFCRYTRRNIQKF